MTRATYCRDKAFTTNELEFLVNRTERDAKLRLSINDAVFARGLEQRLDLKKNWGFAVSEIIANRGDWVSYSRRHDHYADHNRERRYRYNLYRKSNVVGPINQLSEFGLVETIVSPRMRGKQSIVRATPELVQLGREIADLESLSRRFPTELMVLKNADGGLSDYRDTRFTNSKRREMAAINEMVSSARTTGGLNAPLYRVFNGDWKHGGRLYALGPSFQGMKGSKRVTLLMNGWPTNEVDFKSYLLQILYAKTNETPPLDCYRLDGFSRDAAKLASMVVINCRSINRSAAAIALHEEAEELLALTSNTKEQRDREAFWKAHRLIKEFKRVHSKLEAYFHTGIGLRIQAEDAEVTIQLLNDLMKRGIPCLPIHDSYLVQLQHIELLEGVMADASERSFGRVLPMERELKCA